MGHAIIVYRDRPVIVNDHDLWAIRHFVLAELDARPDDGLRRFVAGWDNVGCGVWLGIDWDAFFADVPDREQAFDTCLEGTVQRIASFGSHVPLDYLERHVDPGYRGDQPVDRWVSKIGELRDLFATDKRSVNRPKGS